MGTEPELCGLLAGIRGCGYELRATPTCCVHGCVRPLARTGTAYVRTRAPKRRTCDVLVRTYVRVRTCMTRVRVVYTFSCTKCSVCANASQQV